MKQKQRGIIPTDKKDEDYIGKISCLFPISKWEKESIICSDCIIAFHFE